MKKIIDKVSKGYEAFCQTLLLLMTIMVITFVFLRYFFGVTFVWAEELITILFIGSTYFGAVIGMKYNDHINIGFFADLIPEKFSLYIDILKHLIILGLQIAIILISIKWISKVGNVLTDGLRLPTKYFYIMMPISCVLIGLFCLIHIVKIIVKKDEV